MNYDPIAADYAAARWVFPWIIEPLSRCVKGLAHNSNILEVGCGTGNYIIALANEFPEHSFFGFDQSKAMLAVAQSRSKCVAFCLADAERDFSYVPESFDMIFLVDVIHHIKDLPKLFTRCAQMMKSNAPLIIVTDSEQNIRARSLTHFFPELLEIELRRYPRVDELHAAAKSAHLQFAGAEAADGFIDLSDEFIGKLERRSSSGLRLISPEAHRRGIQRVCDARRRREKWFSCYTVFSYRRALTRERRAAT